VRGVASAAVAWALYAVAYAAVITLFADVPLAYSLTSQAVHTTILAGLSVPAWLVVVRGLDGAGWGRRLAAHAVLLPAYAVGGTALYVGVYRVLGGAEVAAVIAERFGWIALGAATVYVAQFAVYHAVAAAQRAGREREAAERLRARTREQELRSLRAQLNPHFLFNALNAVSAEVGRDPDEAREMIGRLAGLLRYSLDAGRRDLVPLAEEVGFVRDYLDLEGARMGRRLRAVLDVDDEALGAEVPPMALQTLVENAVRHGVAPAPGGGAVTVAARVEGDAVEVLVEDTGVGAAPGALADAEGVGLANTDERLRLLFGEASALRVEADRAQGFAVAFRLPLPDAPARARPPAPPAAAPLPVPTA
jgi:signal transduction histidine kinase